MYYYNRQTDRLIDTEEMKAKYGTERALPALGIFELSVQPDYIPIAFRDLINNTYYPVESYVAVKAKAFAALKQFGLTDEEIAAVFS
jgi:hypothetical protein